MRRIFLDTWAWVALSNKNDPEHKLAVTNYSDFENKGYTFFTSDYIIAETLTLLKSRRINLPINKLIKFGGDLYQAHQDGFLQIIPISWDWHLKAWALCKKYRDHPRVSFFDFASFVAMKELKISQVLTNDAHFEMVGMGFKRVP